ncbi:MAG: hypothetical protein V4675_15830 [Verrucomicrobiota bacterium]
MSRKSLLLQSALCATALGGAFLAGRATVSPPVPAAPASGGHPVVNLSASSPDGMANAATPRNSVPTGGATALGRKVSPNPEQASARLKTIFENEDPVTRMTDFLAFLKTLDSNESRAAALGTLMENFNPRERARELNMLMSDWAGADPVAALASVKDNKDWTGSMAASTVLSKWVQTNPDAAIAWATENGKEANDTENGNFYMVGLLGTLAKTDLDRAVQLAQTGMNRSRARGEVMDRILDQYLSQRSPEAAQTWVGSLGQGPFKEGVIGRLASRLADKDAPAAAAWATALPDSEAKPRAMAEIVQRWSRADPNEAGAWLNRFPASAATDDPRETFAMQVQKKDPEAAIAWAGTITDERRRERATSEVVKSWSEREPDLARQWVDSNNVSERIKRRYGTKPNG